MLGKEDAVSEEIKSVPMGRVIDLRRVKKAETESSGSLSMPESPRPSFGLGLRLPFKKRREPDFLKAYLLKEKEEEFMEEDLLRDYSDEAEEDSSISRLRGAGRIFGLCCLPVLFLLSILGLNRGAKASKDAVSSKDGVALDSRGGRPSWFHVFSNILSWPRSLWSFFGGRTTEDYLYQRAILNEMSGARFNPLRHFLLFAVIVFVVLLPIKTISHYGLFDFDGLKGRVLGVSERAISSLGSAANSVSAMDLDGARDEFSLARDNFGQAKQELDRINSLLFEIAKFVPNKKVKMASYGKEFLTIGESASALGEDLSAAANSFFSGDGKNLSQMIEEFSVNAQAALGEAKEINSSIAKIDRKALPEEYQRLFDDLRVASGDLEMMLASVCDVSAKANVFLGAKSDKRYLFVFQNNSEMRASGGFIGSFALVDFSQGKIKNIEVPGGGSYDTERDLKQFLVSPEPLWLVNPLWHFWDANWWPDWEKSAKKLSWFYEKSGGPTVDGVIAFTPTVLERVLKVIGPIDMTEEYGVTMDSDNLWFNLRDIIEKEKSQEQDLPNDVVEKKPKRVIGDLFGRIMEEMPKRLNKDNFPTLLNALNGSFDDKQVLFYFNDDDLQAEVEKRNWAGRIKETNKDYLYVVNTNIAGGKSDGKMEEKISHKAEIQGDGSIIDTVIIRKIHHGVVDEPYYGVRNVNWLRVYVPEGSQLLAADGFRGPDPIYFDLPDDDWEEDVDVAEENGENAAIDSKNSNTKIYQESRKTVFANWVMVDPGQEVVITLKYKLPFKVEKKVVADEGKRVWDGLLGKLTKVEKKDLYVYSLMVQKQPGMLSSSIESSLVIHDSFSTVWRYPADLDAVSGWKFQQPLEADGYWAVLLEKNNLEQ